MGEVFLRSASGVAVVPQVLGEPSKEVVVPHSLTEAALGSSNQEVNFFFLSADCPHDSPSRPENTGYPIVDASPLLYADSRIAVRMRRRRSDNRAHDKPQMVKRLPQVEQKLRESGYPGDPDGEAPPSGTVLTVEELVSKLAHDVNNPLAVVVANLDVLTELISEMTVEARLRLEAPETREWLAVHVLEAGVCLQDVRQAADRIKTVIQRLHQPRVEVRHPVDAEPTTETKRLVLNQTKARVLVVDDDEDVAWALQRTLRDYDVVVSLKATEALGHVLQGERFNAIVCDVMMPEMLGSDLYEEIERAAPDQAARMIFVTGGATTAKAKAFLSSVERPVLTKPFSPQELRGLVLQLLRAAEKYDSIHTVTTAEQARAKLEDLVGIALFEDPSLTLEDATREERANVLTWIRSAFDQATRERLRTLFESLP